MKSFSKREKKIIAKESKILKQQPDRNKKAKAEFQKVTDEKAKQEYYDYITKEVVKIGKEIQMNWIEARDAEAEMKMKDVQIDSDKIEELYNGMPKSKEKVLSEYMALQFNYNSLIYNINKIRDRLKQLEFSDEDIKKIINGDFNYEEWNKKRKEKT